MLKKFQLGKIKKLIRLVKEVTLHYQQQKTKSLKFVYADYLVEVELSNDFKNQISELILSHYGKKYQIFFQEEKQERPIIEQIIECKSPFYPHFVNTYVLDEHEKIIEICESERDGHNFKEFHLENNNVKQIIINHRPHSEEIIMVKNNKIIKPVNALTVNKKGEKQ